MPGLSQTPHHKNRRYLPNSAEYRWKRPADPMPVYASEDSKIIRFALITHMGSGSLARLHKEESDLGRPLDPILELYAFYFKDRDWGGHIMHPQARKQDRDLEWYRLRKIYREYQNRAIFNLSELETSNGER